MKVILEFDGTEEQEDLQTALDGYKWKNAMWDLDQLLRKTTKYQVSILSNSPKDLATGPEGEIADAIRDAIRRILSEWNLNLD
jgi:hypothetical protein